MWKHQGQKRPPFAESPGPGQESVWDYPRPPALEPDGERVRVIADGVSLADTTSALRLLETASPPTYYLPLSDVDEARLVKTSDRSMCEWKGVAAYFALAESPHEAVAWRYPSAREPYAVLRDYVSFYPGRVECYVGKERVRPQPGHFYGGWITDRVVGPFKGEPGTGNW